MQGTVPNDLSHRLCYFATMSSQEVAKLVALAGDAAARTPDRLAALATDIQDLIDSSIDPLVLVGVLVEGVAVAIRGRVPAECRAECITAALVMLGERLRG